MIEYAFPGGPSHEANRVPGKVYASHPTYATRAEIDRAAGFLNGMRPDLPPVAILMRDDVALPWRIADPSTAC